MHERNETKFNATVSYILQLKVFISTFIKRISLYYNISILVFDLDQTGKSFPTVY